MKIRKILAILMLIGIVGLTGCGDKVSDNNVKDEVNKEVENNDKEEIKDQPEEEEEEKEEEKTEKEKVKEFITGTWGNETAFSGDEVMMYSMAYYTEFKEDGSVIQTGYRNTDKGTYEVIDENVVIALFDHNFYEDPADPDNHEPIEGYVYEVIYHIDHENGTMEAEYSKEFHEKVMSNAEDGLLTKMPAEDESGVVEESAQ